MKKITMGFVYGSGVLTGLGLLQMASSDGSGWMLLILAAISAIIGATIYHYAPEY